MRPSLWKALFSRLGIPVAGAAVALLALGSGARADEYVLGPEDVVSISVWLHPELERTTAIGAEGKIVYPPIGDVAAAGLTTKQLADRIGDKLSAYLRQTTTVTVTVSQYLSRSVFVSGAVAKPGRYGYERIPGIVDVISQAGGALPGADLSSVQVVRREGQARRTIPADVSAALRDGVVAGLPDLKPGDTVVVPAGLGPTAAPGEGAGVLGEVNKPGVYPVGGGQDLWAVLAVAGGLTTRGDLGNVRVITRGSDGGAAVMTVNLRESLQRGNHAPFVVRAGDVVFVSPSGASGAGRAWTGFTQLMSLSRDLLDLVLLRDYLKRQ